MEILEKVPCPCGFGELEVGLKRFGHWRVERLVHSCPSCNSADIATAREREKQFPLSYSLLSLT